MNASHIWDAVAVDTNVLEHMLNPGINRSCHISKTLGFLQNNNTKLLIDTELKIFKEYNDLVSHCLNNSESTNETSILRYWLMFSENRTEIKVDDRDRLMSAIESVVHESTADVDRIFIYIAFYQGKNLISNDENHIVFGPTSESGQRRDRRDRLKQSTKKICRVSQQSNIMTSSEAYAELLPSLQT